jgi:hypothetical protein
MSFNVRKVGNSFKLNYIGGKGRPININKIPNKTSLQSLDSVYLGQPFCNTVSRFQDTRGLENIYLGQPFHGITDGYSIQNIKVTSYHPDVENWLNNVSLNGGSVNSLTISALNTFCYSIDSAQLRNKFYRLNLFCGNNIQACMVPLYISTLYNKIQYGSPFDVNYNFISSDYNETGINAGLTSSGADPTQQLVGTKYLDITIKPAEVTPYGSAVNNMHLAGSTSCTAVSTAQQVIFFNTATYIDNYTLGFQILGGYANVRTTIGSAGINTQILPLTTALISPAQHFISSRVSNSDHRIYQSGVQIGSTNSTLISTKMSTWPSPSLFLFRQSAGYYSNMRISDYSVGLGFNSTEALAYNNILQTFKTALSRS